MAIRNSRILTYYGYKTIEDISIDDSLLKSDGTFENQQKLYYFGKTSIIHLKTYFHPERISVIPEQLFYVREKKRIWNLKYKAFDYLFEKPLWIHAKDINYCHYIGMIINNSNITIPEFENYEWEKIGFNFSHNSTIQEWLHNAPIHFVKRFIEGFDYKSSVTYHLALGLQRLYLKAGILSKIVRNSDNRYMVIRENNACFIEDGYAWYSLQNIRKTYDTNIGVYEFQDSFVIQNIVSICKN